MPSTGNSNGEQNAFSPTRTRTLRDVEWFNDFRDRFYFLSGFVVGSGRKEGGLCLRFTFALCGAELFVVAIPRIVETECARIFSGSVGLAPPGRCEMSRLPEWRHHQVQVQ